MTLLPNLSEVYFNVIAFRKMQNKNDDHPNKRHASCANNKLSQVQEFQKAQNYRLEILNEALKKSKRPSSPTRVELKRLPTTMRQQKRK